MRCTAGTSIFDPTLCESAYTWFAPRPGRAARRDNRPVIVLDPFAGGSVRSTALSLPSQLTTMHALHTCIAHLGMVRCQATSHACSSLWVWFAWVWFAAKLLHHACSCTARMACAVLGAQVRGIVAAKLGLLYIGIDMSSRQAAAHTRACHACACCMCMCMLHVHVACVHVHVHVHVACCMHSTCRQ